MYSIELGKAINYFITFLYVIGLWNRGSGIGMPIFYSVDYVLYLVGIVAVAFTTDSNDEVIFQTEMSIVVIVATFKFWFLIWKKKDVINMLEQTCIFSVQDHASFMLVTTKRKTITDVAVVVFVILHIAVIFATLVVPFVGSERQIFFKVAFPLDWKNNLFAFWLVSGFVFTGVHLSLYSLVMSIFIWYSMVNCALRYEVLGNDLRNMGKIKCHEGSETQREMSVRAKRMLFQQDLINAIDNHQVIRKLTTDLSSYFSNLFFLQIVTGSLSICGSIYCITFVGQGMVELVIHFGTLLYNISEIFMITRLSNDIKVSSDQLSYSLFESEWVDQSISTKKNVLTFSGLLKRSHMVVVGKVYPLSLELFTKILNLSYSIFNILMTMK